MDYSFAYGEKWNYLTSKTLSTEIECQAKSRKKMKCLPYFTNFKMNIPYKASLTYLNYKNEIIKETYAYGIYEKISASQISYKICCLEGCCIGNKEDEEKPQCKDSNKVDVLCSEIYQCFKT